MPLTKSELLIPRVLCIGGKDGEPNDTRGLWITGEIYTYKKHESDGYECYINDANTLAMPVNYPDKFPHLFKPLPWFEKREESELPEYVKSIETGRVYKRIKSVKAYEGFEPADLSDYQEYQKQKQ